ncbi:hypothetical protein C8R47DRAFT_134396 [Mycena vitilis]|nr:hypothetical protein C8R47DRAFT_134396 [Mycena vitilis]
MRVMSYLAHSPASCVYRRPLVSLGLLAFSRMTAAISVPRSFSCSSRAAGTRCLSAREGLLHLCARTEANRVGTRYPRLDDVPPSPPPVLRRPIDPRSASSSPHTNDHLRGAGIALCTLSCVFFYTKPLLVSGLRTVHPAPMFFARDDDVTSPPFF